MSLPVCSACNVERRLTAIEPIAKGHDIRSFECPVCQTIYALSRKQGAYGVLNLLLDTCVWLDMAKDYRHQNTLGAPTDVRDYHFSDLARCPRYVYNAKQNGHGYS